MASDTTAKRSTPIVRLTSIEQKLPRGKSGIFVLSGISHFLGLGQRGRDMFNRGLYSAVGLNLILFT